MRIANKISGDPNEPLNIKTQITDVLGDSILEKILIYISGTKAVSGDNTLIASPGAGRRIVVSSFIIQNESAVDTTLILKSGSSECWRVNCPSQGDGLNRMFIPGREWKLATNSALILNLNGANLCGYSIGYYSESV